MMIRLSFASNDKGRFRGCGKTAKQWHDDEHWHPLPLHCNISASKSEVCVNAKEAAGFCQGFTPVYKDWYEQVGGMAAEPMGKVPYGWADARWRIGLQQRV